MAKKSITGLIKGINDASRAIGNISRTSKTLKGAMNKTGSTGIKLPSKTQKQTAAPPPPPASSAPAAPSWACACGTVNTTKFCGGCGKPSPEAICGKCGWKRTMEQANIKFCGECGTPFGEQ